MFDDIFFPLKKKKKKKCAISEAVVNVGKKKYLSVVVGVMQGAYL